ncbi:MAG TPA: hypothetical protein VJR91_00670 [Burkholderia sp.]|uniref:hypothetical protein n=1 Tax=Burkholderia cepacia TaxID=292 RepID=UPI002148F328|nr:hypothetical protein [Burkholderia cepacia]HKT62077.1 hypothetical protein [Burkholderia sp.]
MTSAGTDPAAAGRENRWAAAAESPPLHFDAPAKSARYRRTGRTVDFRAGQSRFKIFLTNESSCAAAAEPRIFSRANRQFVEPDTHEKRIVRTR